MTTINVRKMRILSDKTTFKCPFMTVTDGLSIVYPCLTEGRQGCLDYSKSSLCMNNNSSEAVPYTNLSPLPTPCACVYEQNVLDPSLLDILINLCRHEGCTLLRLSKSSFSCFVYSSCIFNFTVPTKTFFLHLQFCLKNSQELFSELLLYLHELQANLCNWSKIHNILRVKIFVLFLF